MSCVNSDGFIYYFLTFVLVRTFGTILEKSANKGHSFIHYFTGKYDICGRFL